MTGSDAPAKEYETKGPLVDLESWVHVDPEDSEDEDDITNSDADADDAFDYHMILEELWDIICQLGQLIEEQVLFI